jgi:hypothetical protein
LDGPVARPARSLYRPAKKTSPVDCAQNLGYCQERRAGRGDRPLLTIISPRQAAAPSSANTSGNFGCGDDSAFEAPLIEHEEARYVELRLPRDYMAAIVRR